MNTEKNKNMLDMRLSELLGIFNINKITDDLFPLFIKNVDQCETEINKLKNSVIGLYCDTNIDQYVNMNGSILF